MLKINEIIWKSQFVEKIEKKHHIEIQEVEEVLQGKNMVFRISRGDVKGEDVYLALGKTSGGRLLSIFFILKNFHSVLPISARNMDKKEKRRYKNE